MTLLLRNPSWPSRSAALRGLGIRRRRLLAGLASATLARRMRRVAMIQDALRDTVLDILALRS